MYVGWVLLIDRSQHPLIEARSAQEESQGYSDAEKEHRQDGQSDVGAIILPYILHDHEQLTLPLSFQMMKWTSLGKHYEISHRNILLFIHSGSSSQLILNPPLQGSVKVHN